MTFGDVLAQLVGRRALDAATTRAAFDAILSGAWTPVQVGAFATALRMVGESEETIVAGAEALRATMAAVDHARDVVVDTCGTGGDGAHTLNVSTAAALVVRGCGVVVAKHGNRSVSSRCGSADVVEALGVPIDVPPDRQAEVLAECGMAFLFAPAHHGALRHAAVARRELGVRTIFNALGPLANPARASHQLVGVYDDALRPVLARALAKLGSRGAWVVRSKDGLDEVSPAAETLVSELRPDGALVERTIAPEDFGVARAPLEALRGASSEENAASIVAILSGASHPAVDAIVINAAAALAVAGAESDLRAAADRARASIVRGDARRALDAWRAAALRRSPAAEEAR